MKNNKACGIDELPAKLLKNDKLTNVLTVLFNKYFDSGLVPDIWSRGIIHPIPKSSTTDKREPLNYRGITLAPVIYKIYCSVLNNRLYTWTEDSNILHDAQNGFRKGRRTIDHVTSLTTLIETRKLKRKSTYAAFIDFRKAYDAINRNMLFKKLCEIGISGKIYNALISLYHDVKCCVKVNGLNTDWFKVSCGLKQGCCLSPLLFNLYINDLVNDISSLGLGVDIGGKNVSILLYADDVVILAENEQNLQALLDILKNWCDQNKMTVNLEKSKAVQFRNQSTVRPDFQLKLGNENFQFVNQYTYLGILLTEHLDYTANSASRAFGLLVA